MSIATLIYLAVPAQEPIDPADPAANHPAAAIVRRLNAILLPLLSLIGFLQTILGPLALPTWSRISRTRQRLVRLLGHLAAGRTPRIRTPGPDAKPRRPGARIPTLPRRPGWLPARLDYNARGLAHHLNLLLHEPGVAETIAASPSPPAPCARSAACSASRSQPNCARHPASQKRPPKRPSRANPGPSRRPSRRAAKSRATSSPPPAPGSAATPTSPRPPSAARPRKPPERSPTHPRPFHSDINSFRICAPRPAPTSNAPAVAFIALTRQPPTPYKPRSRCPGLPLAPLRLLPLSPTASVRPRRPI